MTSLETDIAKGAALIREGKLVAFPTETVYGLGADAGNDAAVAAVFAAKERPPHNPLITHVAALAHAEALGRFTRPATALAHALWPGPLTLVLERTADCAVSPLASAGLDTIAVRIPAHPIAHALIAKAARPIVAPSANISGRVSPTLAQHVRDGLQERIAMVIDGGPANVGLESTVVQASEDRVRILRPGGIAREDIAALIAPLELEVDAGPHAPNAPRSPGQLAGHYAPRARVILDVVWPRFDVGLLAFGGLVPRHPGPVRNLSPRGDLREAAANLFRMLHELDALGVETIAVMPIPQEGLGEAINDRLRRAAAPFHR